MGGKQGDNNLTAYLHANDGVYEEQHHYKQSYVGQSLKRGEMHQWQVFCRLILHQSWSPFIFIQISLIQLIFKVTIYFFLFFFLFSFFKLVKVNGSAVLCGTTPKTIQDKSSDFRVKNLSKIQSVLWT